MNQPTSSEHFDQLLDKALSNYAPPEPRPGLEQRILAHMQAHAASYPDLPHRRRLRWLRHRIWIGAGLTAATIALILVLVMIPRNCVSCDDANKFAHRQSPAPASPEAGTITPLQARAVPTTRRPHRLVQRSAIVPTVAVSAELTPQERLLSEFAAHHPDAALELAKSAPSLSQPISVKPLDTEPIHLEALSIRPIDVEPIDLTVPKPSSY